MDPQAPHPCWAGGHFLSSPSTWPQLGDLVAAAVGLRRGRTGPNVSLSSPCQGSKGKWEGWAQEVGSHWKGTVGAES